MVAAPPRDSPLCQWLTTGIHGMPAGPFLSSMVFYRYQTSRRPNGRCDYKPIFAARVKSAGVLPYIMTMHHDWFAAALTYLNITTEGRSVHRQPTTTLYPKDDLPDHVPEPQLWPWPWWHGADSGIQAERPHGVRYRIRRACQRGLIDTKKHVSIRSKKQAVETQVSF
jgi:hypothetical protein